MPLRDDTFILSVSSADYDFKERVIYYNRTCSHRPLLFAGGREGWEVVATDGNKIIIKTKLKSVVLMVIILFISRILLRSYIDLLEANQHRQSYKCMMRRFLFRQRETDTQHTST